MKKVLFGLVLLATTSLTMTSCDDDDDIIPASELPAASTEFISAYFPGMNYTKIEKEGRKYSIELGEKGNQIEVDFDENGDWIEVDGDDHIHLPTNFIDDKIVSYIKTNYPASAPNEAKSNINSIEKKAPGFEVDLVAPDIDLLFDTNGEFVGIDR